jgi:hypothetical protein
VERNPEKPMRIRMFVDDVSGIGLWDEDISTDDLEEYLPISQHLRERIRAWVDEYTASISPGPSWSGQQDVEHDLRGYELSRELQQALGPDYRIQYKAHTPQGRRLARRRGETDPVKGSPPPVQPPWTPDA